MSKISLSKLKAESFNYIAAVEDIIDINSGELIKTVKQVQETESDLEGLREALYFKAERLKRNVFAQEDKRCEGIISKIERQFSTLNISPLGNTLVLLNKNKEILELKAVQKYLRYMMEIETKGEQVLKTLLNSDNKEDWLFLAELLYISMHFKEQEDKAIFLEYSKKLETKLVKVFSTALNDGGISQCKAAFLALSQLEKETLLLDEFMLQTGLFRTNSDIAPPNSGSIDLDTHISQSNQFTGFIKELVSTVEANLQQFNIIFGTDSKYLSYFYNVLFRSVIFHAMERFLDIQDSALFLQSLSSAFRQIEHFGEFLVFHFEDFPVESYMSEGFDQYIVRAAEKEKELFDEILDAFISGSRTQCSYTLMGEKVGKCSNYVEIYKRMLYLIDLCELRAEMFYSSAVEGDIIRYFYRRMTILIERITLQEKDELKICHELSHIHLLTKRYFKEKASFISDFSQKLATSAQEAFSRKLAGTTKTLKGMVESLYFLKENEHLKLLDFIRQAMKSGEILKARNYQIYVLRILTELYSNLYKQVLTIVYSKQQKKNLTDCIYEFVGLVTLTGQTDAIRNFYHLKEICKLITTPADEFVLVYEEFKGSISDVELGKLLKCRKDRDKIREMIENIQE